MVASREERVLKNSSKRLWVFTSGPDSLGGPCNEGVFTSGPSPFIADDGCLHVDPAQSLFPNFHLPPLILSISQTSPSSVAWVYTSGPSPAADLISILEKVQESESLESESLKWLYISLVIQLLLLVITSQCCEQERDDSKDLNTNE